MSELKRDSRESQHLRGVTMAIWCVVVILFATACEGPAVRGVTVTDSAGVRLTITTDGPTIFAHLDSIPTVSIGGPDASGPAQFFRIQGVHLDENDRLWVADGQSGELRIFEADGTHWKTRGGSGEGPGEFLQIRFLGATAADSVLLGDSRTDRITLFDPEGEFVRTERMPMPANKASKLSLPLSKICT